MTLDQIADRVAEIIGVDPEAIGIRPDRADRTQGEVCLSMRQMEALLTHVSSCTCLPYHAVSCPEYEPTWAARARAIRGE
jgi:hypothetical protein